jgi:hypothetical protein
MAQQAKPKSMYHCDEARPQLRRSSTFVVSTFSGKLFSSDVKASLIPALAAPRRSDASEPEIVGLSPVVRFWKERTMFDDY